MCRAPVVGSAPGAKPRGAKTANSRVTLVRLFSLWVSEAVSSVISTESKREMEVVLQAELHLKVNSSPASFVLLKADIAAHTHTPLCLYMLG